MDADALPAELDRGEIRKAMGVLKMLAQSDMERELYEGRLKAKRDLQTLETERRMAEDQRRTAEEQRRTAEEQRAGWQQRYEAANREREEARRDVRRELQERIRLCQRLLRRPVSDEAELGEQSVEELRNQAQRLEREVTAGLGPA